MMNFTTITRWEFKNTLKSRKFLLIFFLQISVLFLMIVVFNSFAANLESEKGLSITPSLTGFATLDVEDQGGLFSKRLNPEVLTIQNSTYNQGMARLANGNIGGFFAVPSNSVALIQNNDRVATILYLDYRDPKRSVIRQEVNNTNQILSSTLTSAYLDSLKSQNNTNQPGITEKTSGESLPLQIVRKVMLAVLLFLPLFLFGNLVIDSIVGEKERKTGEILMAMPLSSTDIILGKSVAVVLTMALQVAMWMIILLGAGFQLKNAAIVYMTVVLTALPIVGLTTIIAAYAKNYKEAGIGLSFAYIFIVGLLIVPLLAYLSRQSAAANISPMTLTMRLFSGETIAPVDILLSFAFILILSLLSYGISIKLFSRDDVVFGPRPGIIRLALELLGIKKRRVLK
ncbi:MAG TPA: ABC transporter permease [Methanobacteriaceae archaeon]|nr:ABC transporter permease [Methanobacteriaceae archaeon]